jgi:hypothetical protein
VSGPAAECLFLLHIKVMVFFTAEVVDIRPKKKVVHDRDPRASTARPWEIGAMSSEVVSSCRTFDRPATALWDAPPKATVAGASDCFVSSGDPILDSLRRQLLLHGAVGIHGKSLSICSAYNST